MLLLPLLPQTITIIITRIVLTIMMIERGGNNNKRGGSDGNKIHSGKRE